MHRCTGVPIQDVAAYGTGGVRESAAQATNRFKGGVFVSNAELEKPPRDDFRRDYRETSAVYRVDTRELDRPPHSPEAAEEYGPGRHELLSPSYDEVEDIHRGFATRAEPRCRPELGPQGCS